MGNDCRAATMNTSDRSRLLAITGFGVNDQALSVFLGGRVIKGTVHGAENYRIYPVSPQGSAAELLVILHLGAV